MRGELARYDAASTGANLIAEPQSFFGRVPIAS